MSKKKQTEDALPFEANINRLQSIIELIEKDSTALEDSLELFEEGINLTRHVQKALLEAEQKVFKLVEADNNLLIEDFIPQDD
jgi:exodeoxyribonuclease VII small subunit